MRFVFYIFVSACILMAMLAPDCSLSGVQTARYCVCLFGYLHCIAHSTKHISTHCLCCVCIVLHEWHHYRQQSDSRNRSRARSAGFVAVVFTGCLGCLCRLVDTALFCSSGGVWARRALLRMHSRPWSSGHIAVRRTFGLAFCVLEK